MKKAKIRVGILTANDPELLFEEHRIKMMLNLQGESCQSFNSNERVRFDVILLLDTGGLNCATSAFFPHFHCAPNYKPQDQAVEHFRCFTLSWYVDKQIPIIGIGTGALLIWSECLKGKLDYRDGECFPFRSDKAFFDCSEEEDWNNWSFRTDRFVGLHDTPSDETLWEEIAKITRKSREDRAQALVIPTPVEPEPPVLPDEMFLPG